MAETFQPVTAADLTAIRGILNSGRDYWRAYDILSGYGTIGSDRQFWFEQASIINRMANGVAVPQDNNLSGRFILDYTAFGLAVDGRSVNLGTTSNNIARNVLQRRTRPVRLGCLSKRSRKEILR